ncbi:MAG: efflux transporter outer membrane subunit [Boseongicola sp.]|nr:efflux transporter outer membrane subunit [Boseongicola sp.]
MSACAIGPEYKQPIVDVPADWRVSEETTADLVNTAWWTHFRDPVLDGVIYTALKENKDLTIAALRVREFEARAGIARSDRAPQVSYSTSASSVRLSENRPLRLPAGTDPTNEDYEIGVGLKWELDLWGRVRNSSDAARADLLATEEAQHAVMLELVSEVASAYIRLLCLDEKLSISKRSLNSREQTLKLFETRFSGGAIPELELAQARSAYEEAAGFVPVYERQIALQENALSSLLGRNPGPVIRSRQFWALSVPPVPKGIPSSILERRPDIRQAEQNLIAANARIGVAKASYFPTISLTGLFGYASTELTDLTRDTARFAAFGADTLGQIFSGGRRSGEVRRREAVMKQMIVAYMRSVQHAFREVDDALVARQKYAEQAEIGKRKVAALQDYVALARKRYEGGYTGYLEVLDAERALYGAQIEQTSVECQTHLALIGIYKAMGGGWPAADDFVAAQASRATIETLVAPGGVVRQ